MRSKLKKIGAMVAVACMALTSSAVELDLAGEWMLLGSNEVGAAISCPIAVPGDTHSALLAGELIPDPFWGCNETNIQWIGRHDWTVRRSFTVSPELLSKKVIILRLEDCDTFCTVRLNGRIVGKTQDRFQRYDLNVKPYLELGENIIEGFFESAERIGNERRIAYGRPYPIANVPWAKNQALVRKPACHAGWDWGPAMMHMGFCGTTKIIASDNSRVDYVYSTQDFNSDYSHCTLTVFADKSDGMIITNIIEIDNPPLWWPNGAGERRFFYYTMDENGHVLSDGRTKNPVAPLIRHRIGLRKIEVDNTPDMDEKGREGAQMVIKVNGRALFMKGANWIPCSAFEAQQTLMRYRDLLGSAAAANMNMIRLWGGGQYERDWFYEICDELGILIWHDMMCSCAVYPGDDGFLGEIGKELSHQLRRLRDHASVALWCGDNECLGAIFAFKEMKDDQAFYRSLWVRRSRFQGENVRKYDPYRTYWPSSPCAGPGSFEDNWKNDSQGDMHAWQVWHENARFDAYYGYRPRFCSEFGYQSFPSMSVAEKFATRDQICAHAPEFEWHQKNAGGNRRIRETMLRYFGSAKDVESELILSQFQQGMAIKMAVDGWRAQRPRCMGTLFWQLNDNWPVASWSSIEYGGKWKPLQYMAKRFYAPVAIVAQPEITNGKADVARGKIYALNDTSEVVVGELLVEYWTYDGRVVSADTRTVVLPPDSSTNVGSFAQGERSVSTFLVLTLKTKDEIYQNDWHFGFYKDNPLAMADITAKVSDGGRTIVLSTDKPAFFVWIDDSAMTLRLEDNCMTLLPGRDRTIRILSPVCAGGHEISAKHLREIVKAAGKYN